MPPNSRERRRQRRALAPLQAASTASAAQKPLRRIAGELGAYLHRFPNPGGASLAFSVASVVLGNGYALWLVLQGRLGVAGIVLLVLVEGVLLSLIETAQREFVPPDHRMAYDQKPGTLPEKVMVWTAFVFAMAGAYGLWIHINGDTATLIAHLTTLEAWQQSGLHVAVGITLLFAVAGLVADHRHYRRAGPPLVSSVSIEAMSRRMTFIYGAMVFVIPLFGLLGLTIWGLVRLLRNRGGSWKLAGGVIVLAAGTAIFFGLMHLADAGPVGWCFVYLLGKVFVESLFALLPLLAEKRLAQRRGGSARPAEAA